MRIYPTTKILLKWDIVATVDLSAATAKVFIEGAWHDLSWLTASALVGTNFVRTAAVVVGGSESDAAIIMTYRQDLLVQVTVSGQTLVAESGLVGVF